MTDYNIIIIGAGAAGLMAAHELSNAGKKVLLIEAQNRIGGRIHTITGNGFSSSVELGAEFIHGDLPVTERLLKESKIKYSVCGGKMLNISGKEEGNFNTGWDILDEKLKEVKEDMSIQDFMATYFKEEKYSGLKKSIQNFAEGYDTADISKASIIAFRDEWLSEEHSGQYRVDGGYGQLMDYLLNESTKHGGKIKLASIVKEIKWQEGKVEIKTADSSTYMGAKVIITVPMGVLTAGKTAEAAITFTPAILPQLNAAAQIGYGCVLKILIEFDEALWNNKETEKRMGVSLAKMSFLFSGESLPTWWTQYPAKSNLLTGWLGGQKAEQLKSADEKTIYEKAVQSLAAIFKLSIKEIEKKIVAHKVINWTIEPFALGSYCYATLDTVEARKLLTQPVQNTLYFAGEALYDGPEMGTVEAALASGLKVAQDVLK